MQKELNRDYFLWESFKNGDDHAFFNLYDQYADSLLGFGLHFTRNTEIIKDCIHDLFLDLYKYRKNLSVTDNIKFYLFRSLKRIIQRELSKNSLFNQTTQSEISVSEIEPAHDENIINLEIKLENAALLEAALNKLTSQQKEALFLKFEQNLSYPEIAQIQGISVESARTNIYRALKALRKSISEAQFSFSTLFILLLSKI